MDLGTNVSERLNVMFDSNNEDEVNAWKSVIKDIEHLRVDNKFVYIKPVNKIKFKKEIEYIPYELDLHGYSVQEAYENVLDFIKKHYANKSKYIIIITGKGTDKKEGLIHGEIINWFHTNKFILYIKNYKWINNDGALKIWLKSMSNL